VIVTRCLPPLVAVVEARIIPGQQMCYKQAAILAPLKLTALLSANQYDFADPTSFQLLTNGSFFVQI
jgi:hypothetical protein